MQIILGIDPGYDRLGWGIIKSQQRSSEVIDYGCIQTQKNENIFERYQQILKDLATIIKKHQPTVAAIETLYFSKNTKTALRVSESRGLVIGLLLANSCQVLEYSPQAVKLAVTGYGRADKLSVEKMVRAELNLGTKKIIDDTLDALAIAITHAVSM